MSVPLNTFDVEGHNFKLSKISTPKKNLPHVDSVPHPQVTNESP